jgi:hypothetical protein
MRRGSHRQAGLPQMMGTRSGELLALTCANAGFDGLGSCYYSVVGLQGYGSACGCGRAPVVLGPCQVGTRPRGSRDRESVNAMCGSSRTPSESAASPQKVRKKRPSPSQPHGSVHFVGVGPERIRSGLARQRQRSSPTTPTASAAPRSSDRELWIDLLDTGSEPGSLAGTHWVHIPAVNDR